MWRVRLAMTTALSEFVSLESGDRLSRQEFHRRYCLRPDIRKAELVQGVVYVASPTRITVHGRQHRQVTGWLDEYVFRTPGVDSGIDSTIYLSDEDEVVPDACLFYLSNAAGTDHL
jgi:hypothetical protein